MENQKILQKVSGLPIGTVATCVGACTLSNVYNGLGYEGIRHVTVFFSILVWCGILLKIVFHFKIVRAEYSNVVPSSLYASVTMLTMSISQYLFGYYMGVGRALWITAVVVHVLHILLFTYRHIWKKRVMETFLPCWFVTYNGFLTAAVTGVNMGTGIEKICKAIVLYGLIIFVLFMPLMVRRLIKHPVMEGYLHTKAVMLSPPSLCLVGYLNFTEKPNMIVVYFLYLVLLATLIYNIYNLPKFFMVAFHPGFASLTFPMAIGVVASGKMSEYLKAENMELLGNIVKEIEGIQLYITSAIILFIVFHFLKMFTTAMQMNIHKGQINQ